MNYRHAYHAGNFADCVKHALLLWLVRALQRKEKPAFFLDTHAGRGRYDLASPEALQTGEWREGIALLRGDPDPALADYLCAVERLGLYPGSPRLIRSLLRPIDRLACCEPHPEEVAALKREFAHDPQVAIHRRDGFEALGALLPPRERRGLTFIDPPFEAEDEFARLHEGLRRAQRRFPSGVIAAWYPIKNQARVRQFHAMLQESGPQDALAAELWRSTPLDPTRLNGSGLIIVNPPFGFPEAASALLRALHARLARETGSGYAIAPLDGAMARLS